MSLKKLAASAAAMVVAVALSVSMAIPAVSASSQVGTSQTSFADVAVAPAHFTLQPAVVQDLTVSGRAVPASFVRDGSTVTRSWKPAGSSIAASSGWVAPINRKIVSGWGPRAVICTSGVGCDSGFHHGDDFAAPCNTPFYTVTAGVVTSVTHAGLAGDEIVITHAGGVSTAYSHMFDSGILVSTGQRVTAGQNIGLVGSTGDSTGCHLYFEFRMNGTTVNPQPAMAAHGVILG